MVPPEENDQADGDRPEKTDSSKQDSFTLDDMIRELSEEHAGRKAVMKEAEETPTSPSPAVTEEPEKEPPFDKAKNDRDEAVNAILRRIREQGDIIAAANAAAQADEEASEPSIDEIIQEIREKQEDESHNVSGEEPEEAPAAVIPESEQPPEEAAAKAPETPPKEEIVRLVLPVKDSEEGIEGPQEGEELIKSLTEAEEERNVLIAEQMLTHAGHPAAKEEPLPEKPPKKSLLSRFIPSKEADVALYNYPEHGPLVEAELPEGYDETETYWVEEGCALVIIAKNEKTHQNEYLLFEPVLSGFERELIERLHEDLRDVLILTDEELYRDRQVTLLSKTLSLISEYGIILEKISFFKLQYYLTRNFLGWSRLDPLMKDDQIEDISCDGSKIPIFLYHRKYHNIKTNISYAEATLNSLAITLAQRSGKHISISSPMLDATLPDGSRLQLTLGTEVTTRGTSFTIRKFREDPITPIDLMEYHTFNADMLVYFWLAIENQKSLVFVGGTASGKTTSLNAVSLFIPPISKVVSIEDTREITLYHDNWIASVTRDAIVEAAGIRIDMFDLLRAAMRQRPEYILVGEVRGKEAQTLFQAMNTGHTTFSTMHANSVDAAIHRLENPPLDVPRNMIQALDVVSIQALVFKGADRVRRSLEIVEIAGIDPATGNLRVNLVFEYDPVADEYSFSGRSEVYSAIMDRRGWTRDQLNMEIDARRRILNAMKEQDIHDFISVSRIFQAYSIDPSRVMASLEDLTKAIE